MARTVAHAVKNLLPDASWRLEMFSSGEIDSNPLQRWRGLGTGDDNQMSRRQKIAESLCVLSGQDVDIQPSSPVQAGRLRKCDLESNGKGNSGGMLRIMRRNGRDKPQDHECAGISVPDVADSARAPFVGNMPLVRGRSSPSFSNASEFKNADSFESEAEEHVSKNDECVDSSDKRCLGKEDVEFADMEAYDFQIFHCDDIERRVPVSVFDLAFNDNESEGYQAKLILIASPSAPPISNYMSIIDSWTMRADKKAQLLLYVRDVKGTWYKLCTPAKRYNSVFDDCRITIAFLEFAIKLGNKFKKPHTYFTKIQKLVRVEKSKIRDVLKKYYTSVIQKFVFKGGIPLLRDAEIIRNMKDSLRVSNVTPNLSLGKTLKSGVQKKIAMAIRIVSKRKRVVESYPDNINESGDHKEIAPPKKSLSKRKLVVLSDSEDETGGRTDSEDLKPLLQRRFKRKKNGRCSESTSVMDDSMKICSGQGQDPKRWRSDKVHEVAEVRELGVLKEDLDISEKFVGNIVGIAEPTKEKVEGRAGDYANPRLQVLPEMTGLYGGQGDMPEEFDSDDEEVGDAAFCAICDDGGDLLFCDGPCVRSFHASRRAAAASSESKCRSLGLTAEEVKDMGSWLCPNCEFNRHQCFICGNLGNSEGENKEVFLCDVALCGRFYHPQCLGVFTNMNKREISTFVKRIKDGAESVFCPAHKCLNCLEGEFEGGTDNSMKLAKCRRCPKAYHKNCLPSSISFEETDDHPVRAWEIGDEDDPVKRLVIYCTDHIIDEELNTPKRDHLRWPEEYFIKTGRRKEESRSAHEYSTHSRERKYGAQSSEGEDSLWKATPILPGRPKGLQKKSDTKKSVSKLSSLAQNNETGAIQREQHVPCRAANTVQQQKAHFSKREPLAVLTIPISREAVLKKVRELQEMSASVVTVESVHQSLFHPSCYLANSKKNLIRRGDLVSIINAAKKAVDKIQGGNIEDAKRICPRAYFQSLFRGEDALKVYLAPLLHGTRYTSYGRHFTNPDKLKEIIERIHWYIDDGDMVVDFCCGANDFSTLLKAKLESVGKKCDYRNFDIHPPKNTFAFTKGDWFENKGEGFAEGKKLVIGLNPPFGSKAALATKFVIHALKFRPKLLVLIVPPETMDGGRKYAEFNYGLVWEDGELLSGKSFYLPGSLHKSDEGNLAQWNFVAPPLFLWCPAEMLRKNQEIAVQQKHIRSLLPGVPDLHTPSLRDLQSDHSEVLTMHHLGSKLHVAVQEVRMQTTPVPSPIGARDLDLRASSGGVPGRSKSPLLDREFPLPQCLQLQRSSSPNELSTPSSNAFSTSQTSSSSQDGHIPSHAANSYRHSFKPNPFHGPKPTASLPGHCVPPPKIVPEIYSGLGESDVKRNKVLVGMHDHALTGRRPGPSREAMVRPGVNTDHSGFVSTNMGLGPATATNLHFHRNLPMQRQPPFGMMQMHQGESLYSHMPLNTQSGPDQPRWTLGGLPPTQQSMHMAHNQFPVHHAHGSQGFPLAHPHIPGTSRFPGGPAFLPTSVNPFFTQGGVGEGRFGRVLPPTGGMRMGGPPSFGSGGWIEHDN